MSTILLLATVISAVGEMPSDQGDNLKPYHIYSQQARSALRDEARASKAERGAAIRELAGIYRELKADPRLETSDFLTGLKAKLWSRLTSVKEDLLREMERENRRAERRNQADEVQGPSEIAAETLAAELTMASYSMGGPSALVGQSGAMGGGAVLADYGQVLVDLIERTIAPDKWDTVGGPFSIVYYAPLRVLVVSATSEVHGEFAGLLDGLRRAGP